MAVAGPMRRPFRAHDAAGIGDVVVMESSVHPVRARHRRATTPPPMPSATRSARRFRSWRTCHSTRTSEPFVEPSWRPIDSMALRRKSICNPVSFPMTGISSTARAWKGCSASPRPAYQDRVPAIRQTPPGSWRARSSCPVRGHLPRRWRARTSRTLFALDISSGWWNR